MRSAIPDCANIAIPSSRKLLNGSKGLFPDQKDRGKNFGNIKFVPAVLRFANALEPLKATHGQAWATLVRSMQPYMEAILTAAWTTREERRIMQEVLTGMP